MQLTNGQLAVITGASTGSGLELARLGAGVRFGSVGRTLISHASRGVVADKRADVFDTEYAGR
jgi:NAD(P)-dependent dehydrogenase (short-subunit alcohol dehydrogenase family)